MKKILAVLFGVLAFGIMTACGAPAQSTPIPELTVPAVTAVPSPSRTAIGFPPVPNDPTKQAYATLVAINDDVIRTRVALTHEPTETHGRPPTVPTTTPVMGIFQCSRYPSKDRRPISNC